MLYEVITAAVVKREVENLIATGKEGDKFDIVRKMKEIVPEFISKNSVFEVLDNKE